MAVNSWITGNPEVMPRMDFQRRGPEVLVLYLERPRAKSWELRSLWRGRFRYSDLKEGVLGDYGICIRMSRS